MSILVFAMVRLLPGDIVDIMVGEAHATDEAKQEVRRAMGLDEPIPVQYGKWISGFVRVDFGQSLRTKEPVTETLRRSLPLTVELTLLAVLIASTVAIPLGIVSAVRTGSAADAGARFAGLIGLSIPSFWLATLMLAFTSRVLHWVPPFSLINPFTDPVGNLVQLALPATSLAVGLMAIVMRMTRTTMLEVLRQDYVRTARAKGLPPRRVLYRHGLRNALIPVISIIGFQIGTLMGGSAVVEMVFSLNGIGFTLIQAIFQRDYPVIQACALLLATVFVLISLVVDLLYVVIDPRIGRQTS